jgi:hypothetical protein
MTAILGYARVSTGGQDAAGQIMHLKEAGAIKVFTDVKSGKSMERPTAFVNFDAFTPNLLAQPRKSTAENSTRKWSSFQVAEQPSRGTGGCGALSGVSLNHFIESNAQGFGQLLDRLD